MFSKASRFNYPKAEVLPSNCCGYVSQSTPKLQDHICKRSTKSRHKSREDSTKMNRMESNQRCASCDTHAIELLSPIQKKLMTELPPSPTWKNASINDSDCCSSCSNSSAEILGIDLANVGEMKCQTVYEYLTALEEAIYSQRTVDQYAHILGPLIKSEKSQCRVCSLSIDLKSRMERVGNVDGRKPCQNMLYIYMGCIIMSCFAVFTYSIMC